MDKITFFYVFNDKNVFCVELTDFQGIAISCPIKPSRECGSILSIENNIDSIECAFNNIIDLFKNGTMTKIPKCYLKYKYENINDIIDYITNSILEFKILNK